MMGRFSDEFFGGDTPSHDELVSMTIDKRDGIIRRILPKILKSRKKLNPVNVYLCPRGKAPPWCTSPWHTSDFRTEFRVEPICLVAAERYPSYFVDSSIGELRLPRKLRLCPESTWARQKLTPEDICDYLNDLCESGDRVEDFYYFYWGLILLKSDYGNGTYIHSVLPDYDQMMRFPAEILESYEVDWETEKICKRETGFIVGYADIVFDFQLKIRKDIMYDDSGTWGRHDQEGLNLRVVTEAKPRLTSWGAPLRQLKTYMDILRKRRGINSLPIAGVISTFSKVPLKFHKILEKENVYIIRFTKKGEISDGVSPGQTRL